MSKIIFIEGKRNVGKSYLIQNLSIPIKTYKFPFIKYYNECFTNNIKYKLTYNNKPELFFLTLGYDITILDLIKQNIITDNIIVDRGILSDIVFGIQSNRISYDDALNALVWLYTIYKDYFEIVYIYTDIIQHDNRNKDVWNIYNGDETIELYNKVLSNNFIDNITYINNNFQNNVITTFNDVISKII